MVRAGVALVVFVVASLIAAPSFAAPHAGAPTADAGVSAPDADALVVELDRQIAALSTGDCVLACQSLGAMRRTVERICALDPGPRCDKARDKVQDVARRVAAACPTCADAPGVVVAKPSVAPREAPSPALVAQAAPGKAGCAACNVGASDESDLWALGPLLALAALAVSRRRRRPPG